MAKKMAIMSVYLPEDLFERIKELAAADGRSASSFVTRHLAKRFAEKPLDPRRNTKDNRLGA